MKAYALALLTTCVVLTAAASDKWTHGDVIRTDEMNMIMCPAVPPMPAIYTRELAFKSFLDAGTLVGFDDAGSLRSVSGDYLVSANRETPLSILVKLPEYAAAIAVDTVGSSYIVGESGRLYVYSRTGVRVRASF